MSTGPSSGVVSLILDRAHMQCEVGYVCGGRYLGGHRGRQWSVHHRRSRGMGGSSNPAINLPANLLAVCGSGTTGCHGFIEANRVWAHELGLLLHDVEERLTRPVFTTHGNVLLDDAGSWTLCAVIA